MMNKLRYIIYRMNPFVWSLAFQYLYIKPMLIIYSRIPFSKEMIIIKGNIWFIQKYPSLILLLRDTLITILLIKSPILCIQNISSIDLLRSIAKKIDDVYSESNRVTGIIFFVLNSVFFFMLAFTSLYKPAAKSILFPEVSEFIGKIFFFPSYISKYSIVFTKGLN